MKGFRNLCLDDKAGASSNGNPVDIWQCTGGSRQRWTRNSAGEYWLSSVGLCLTDPGGSTTNGTQVQVQNCVNTPAQHWSVP